MKKYLLFCFAFFPAVSLVAQTDAERLDEVMQAAAQTKIFSGVVLAARHDSILLFKGYGYRDIEHQIPHDTNSIFQIGSLTKPFTAIVILWLQEQGKLNLADKLSQYFPEYRYAGRITIRNLLTHTSGIPNYIDEYFLAHQADRSFNQAGFWEIIRDQNLLFEPDSGYAYSNSNYMLLSYIIEKVSGKPYEQMVREVIFNKAGMTHSGFDFAHLHSPHKVVGYENSSENPPRRTRIGDSSAVFAAGSIYTTAGDLYRWNRALYGNKIISQASQEQAYTPYKSDYGYGWTIGYDAGRRFVTHNGYIWGFQSHMKRIPADSTCVIVLQNEDRATMEDYVVSIYRILDHDPYYIPRKTIQLSIDSLLPFTGHYQLAGKPEFQADIALKEEHLMITWTHLQPQEIFAERQDFFHFKVYNMQLAFTRDEHGHIAGFSAIGNGQTFVYTRL